MNRLLREQQMKKELRKLLKDFDNRTVATRVLLEFALERASIYKYQKELMVIEIQEKLKDGEYEN
jgi:hypothetical protein